MDEGGTELVEAYGGTAHPRMSMTDQVPDYLFKFIVVGKLRICTTSSSSFVGEAGTGKSCLLYHCIHETCELRELWCDGAYAQSRSILRIR